MKRGIYIFALLIATLALLADIIIPHHHHEDEICFADSHCNADCNHQDHSSAEDNHDAEKGEDHQNCLLDVEILLPPQQDDTGAENIIYLDVSFGIDGLTALLTNLLLEDQILQGQQIWHSPPILQYHSRKVIGSPGLRAPPVC